NGSDEQDLGHEKNNGVDKEHGTEDDSLFSSSGIDRPHIMSSFVEMWLCHFIKFVRRVPGFSRLDISDQTTLVKSRWREVWLISSYRDRCQAENKVTGNAGSEHYNEEKVIYGPKYAELSQRWQHRLKDLDVSQEELVLIMMVCLTCPDSCHLHRTSQVSRLHWLMRQALCKHIDKMRVGDAYAFPKVLSAALSVKADIGESLLAFNVQQVLDSRGQCAALERPLLAEMLRDGRGVAAAGDNLH
ncbi:hypothetical protein EGW08_012076, partial [Elysia chlorotica]